MRSTNTPPPVVKRISLNELKSIIQSVIREEANDNKKEFTIHYTKEEFPKYLFSIFLKSLKTRIIPYKLNFSDPGMSVTIPIKYKTNVEDNLNTLKRRFNEDETKFYSKVIPMFYDNEFTSIYRTDNDGKYSGKSKSEFLLYMCSNIDEYSDLFSEGI